MSESRGVSRRFFATALLTAAVAPGTVFARRFDPGIDGFDLVRSVFDPPDFALDPMLVKPMPVRVGETSAHIHCVVIGPAELRLEIGARNGAKRTYLTVSVPTGLQSVFIPLTVKPGLTYQWVMRWRGSVKAPWNSSPVNILRTLSTTRREAKIIIVGDTHSLIEGLTEQEYGSVRRYGVLPAFHGSTFDIIRTVEPDVVVFTGDDTGIDAKYIWRQKQISHLEQVTPNVLGTLQWRLWRQFITEQLGGVSAVQVLGNHDGFCGFNLDTREWTAIGKKLYFPNPGPEFSSLGGENNGEKARLRATTLRGACSPLENYFGMRIGPVDLFGLDIMGYTGRGSVSPRTPEAWTYGPQQMLWLAKGLAQKNTWKLIVTHHLAGGIAKGPHGEEGWIAYGRGGVKFAGVGEQASVHALMCDAIAAGRGVIHAGAHDHNWWHGQANRSFVAHQVPDRGDSYLRSAGPVYLGCGTPSHLPTWGDSPYNTEMYDNRDIIGKGIILITANDARLTARYIKTGEAGNYFDNKPAREMRTPPDTPIGGIYDSFNVAR